MAISIFPLLPDFGAEIGDVDLARPLSPEDREAIKAAFWKYGVLVFPAQTLTQAQESGASNAYRQKTQDALDRLRKLLLENT